VVVLVRLARVRAAGWLCGRGVRRM
jgi:hypothetical protein